VVVLASLDDILSLGKFEEGTSLEEILERMSTVEMETVENGKKWRTDDVKVSEMAKKLLKDYVKE